MIVLLDVKDPFSYKLDAADFGRMNKLLETFPNKDLTEFAVDFEIQGNFT